jgi:two-component system sensor histidine kinase VicK
MISTIFDHIIHIHDINEYLLMDSLPSTSEDVEEKTEIIYGIENIIQRTLECFSSARIKVDSCVDALNPPTTMATKPIVDAIIGLKKRGVKSRLITDITRDNLDACKEIIKITTEVRHLDEVKGNFSILDGSIYEATMIGNFLIPNEVSSHVPLNLNENSQKSKVLTQSIYSSVKVFVGQQQYFFDMLWKKSIPARQRIKEIEEDLKREFIETIQNSEETINLISNILSSAAEEIMIMFPTIKSFHLYEREGILDLIKRQLENGITVRILLAEKDRPPQRAWKGISSFPNLHIQYTDQLSSNRLTMVIVDNELSLVIEEKKYEDPVGITTYSNSESTVQSYASIFENLWIQSEIKQQ